MLPFALNLRSFGTRVCAGHVHGMPRLASSQPMTRSSLINLFAAWWLVVLKEGSPKMALMRCDYVWVSPTARVTRCSFKRGDHVHVVSDIIFGLVLVGWYCFLRRHSISN